MSLGMGRYHQDLKIMCIHISVGINMHICVYIYIYILIAGHNRLWVDGAVPILSINTISHATNNSTDPIVKKIFIFDREY
jgi:hypothetical protein